MRVVFLALASVVVVNVAPAQTPLPFDVVIVNGHVVDGTGSPW
jgi:hypothetical protein